MNFSEKDIQAFAKKYYQLDVDVTMLNGYDELNCLLTDSSGKKFIFKIASSFYYK